MDRAAWTILLITAATDFIIGAGGAITAAMVAKEMVAMPSGPVVLLATATGLIAAARTIQQELRRQQGQKLEVGQ